MLYSCRHGQWRSSMAPRRWLGTCHRHPTAGTHRHEDARHSYCRRRLCHWLVLSLGYSFADWQQRATRHAASATIWRMAPYLPGLPHTKFFAQRPSAPPASLQHPFRRRELSNLFSCGFRTRIKGRIIGWQQQLHCVADNASRVRLEDMAARHPAQRLAQGYQP